LDQDVAAYKLLTVYRDRDRGGSHLSARLYQPENSFIETLAVERSLQSG